jgi:hypothetical protein
VNVRTDRLRLRRWRDFRRRVESPSRNVYRHRAAGWEYIPIHPFGDEPKVLARLGLRPEECRMVDAWWGIDQDATLLQSSIAVLSPVTPGLYAFRSPYEEGWVYLRAVFDAPFVTRALVEAAMDAFAEAGFPGAELFRQLRVEQGAIRLPSESPE